MERRNVIGLGTGRCGTKSLAHLLDLQHRSYVTHERFQWRVPWNRLKGLELADLVIADCDRKDDYLLTGDVAFYWYEYIGYFMEHLDNVCFPVMKRAKEKVVDSYMRITPDRNHWQEFEEPHPEWHYDKWDHCFPNIPAPSKREAIEQYWDGYYTIMEKYQNIFPTKLRVFPVSTLNSREGQDELFSFIGIPEEQREYEIGLRRNRTV